MRLKLNTLREGNTPEQRLQVIFDNHKNPVQFAFLTALQQAILLGPVAHHYITTQMSRPGQISPIFANVFNGFDRHTGIVRVNSDIQQYIKNTLYKSALVIHDSLFSNLFKPQSENFASLTTRQLATAAITQLANFDSTSTTQNLITYITLRESGHAFDIHQDTLQSVSKAVGEQYGCNT